MTTIQQLVTAERLLTMPDDGFRYELVRGELRKMPPAGFQHGRIAMRVGRRLDEFAEETGLGWGLAADTGFILESGPDHVRAPDAAFVRQSRVDTATDTRGFFLGPPDIAFEVISPTDRYTDVAEKVADYLAAGTLAVVVIDPRRRTVQVHRPTAAPVELDDTDTLEISDVVPRMAYARQGHLRVAPKVPSPSIGERNEPSKKSLPPRWGKVRMGVIAHDHHTTACNSRAPAGHAGRRLPLRVGERRTQTDAACRTSTFANGHKSCHTAGHVHDRQETWLRLWSRRRVHPGVRPRPRSRAPDVSFVRQARVDEASGSEGFFPGPPDIAFEVISPTDRYTDVAEKVADYLAAGTLAVVVIDPRRRTVQVHRPTAAPVELDDTDTLEISDVVPGWRMPVREIFD